MTKKLQPELRFKEFNGDWEEKKLNQVSTINPKSESLPDEFVYINLESVEKGLLIQSHHIRKTEAPSRAQRLLSDDDILFQTVRPYQKNNYYFKLGKNYVASTGYAQIRAKKSSEFLYHQLHTDKFVNKVLLRCTGTSYPAINSNDLSKIKILLPTLSEQTKIANFLTAVDDKITNAEKQLVLIKDYKKGIMQRIFSQEIRFKDDDGKDFPDWEEKKLRDLTSLMQSGLSRMLSDLDIGLPVIRSNNLIDGRLNLSEIKYWYRLDPQGSKTKNYFLNDNDLLINFINSQAQIGKVAIYKNILNRDVIFTTNIMRIRFKSFVNPLFVVVQT